MGKLVNKGIGINIESGHGVNVESGLNIKWTKEKVVNIMSSTLESSQK